MAGEGAPQLTAGTPMCKLEGGHCRPNALPPERTQPVLVAHALTLFSATLFT